MPTKRKPTQLQSTKKEEAAFSEIAQLIEASRERALQAVNTALIGLYWEVGGVISRKIEAAEWGDAVVDRLAAFLAKTEPGLRGFTRRNLFRMRQFYEAYREDPIVSPLVAQLPWSHHLIILGQSKRPEEREFYIRLAIRERWSKRELELQFKTALFELAVLHPPKVTPAVTQRYPTNPIANVRQLRKRTIEPSIQEPAEIAAILRELEGVEPVRTAFLIAAVMGMRRGEIFGLKWGDVDFGRAILHVRRSYVDGVVGPTKTDSSRRPLPIPEQALNALSNWKQESLYTDSEHWVFASAFHFGKQPLWPGTLWQRNVTPAIKQTGITKSKLGRHTLRRSFASLLLSEGASLRVSMELMRHSTSEMALGTYAQTVGEEKREASSKVELRLFPKGKVA